MIGSGRDPALSIVLATDSYETIRPVVAHLRRQTVRDQLELVLVGPSRSMPAANEGELDGFAAVRTVEVDSVVPLSRARAAGVRAASAPLVFIGETHSYARPDCMEAFLRAHDSNWSVVVPGFANANPEGTLSWASFALDYGTWWEGLQAKAITFAPCYNVVGKRSVFLEFGDRLERVFSHGDAFLEGLRERGHSIYFEPAATVAHLNGSTAATWKLRYVVGRVRGADRGAVWPIWRRAAYVLGSPLIPAVLFWRLKEPLGALRKRSGMPAGTSLVVGAILAVTACGEMVGYAMGAGSEAERRVDEFEIRKVRFVRRSHRPRPGDER